MKHEINRHDVIEKITPLIENTAMRYNLIPIEIDFEKENHRWFLRIFLFSYDHNVTLEDCERVTRSLEDFLDELIPCKYYLEVSSPGLERKFKSDKEYKYFCEQNVIPKSTKPMFRQAIEFCNSENIKIRYDDNLIKIKSITII